MGLDIRTAVVYVSNDGEKLIEYQRCMFDGRDSDFFGFLCEGTRSCFPISLGPPKGLPSGMPDIGRLGSFNHSYVTLAEVKEGHSKLVKYLDELDSKIKGLCPSCQGDVYIEEDRLCVSEVADKVFSLMNYLEVVRDTYFFVGNNRDEKVLFVFGFE